MAEGAPGVEAAGEGPLLVAFADQSQAAGPLVFFRACVLDVHLVRKTVAWVVLRVLPDCPVPLPMLRPG